MAIGSLIPHKFKVKGKSARSGNLSQIFYLPFFGAQKRPLSAPIPDFTSQSPSVFPAFRARFFACQLRPSCRTALRNLSYYILWFPPIGIPIHLSEKSVRSDRSGRAELPHPNRTLPPHRPRLLPTAPPDRRRLRGRSAAYRLGSQQPKRPKGAGAPPLIHPRTLLMCDKEAIEVQKILPFLSDTWPLCRIGRAVIRASQSCRQSCNKSQCPACGCRSHHSCTHAPQFSRSFPAREWGSVLQRQGACGQCP